MNKVQLKLCMGTMCYVMGGGQLRSMVESLPPEMKENLDIVYSPCLGYCNEKSEPPYVELNGRPIACVGTAGLMQLLKEELKNVVR